MLAYEGAIFVPVAVPLICKKMLSIKCKVAILQYQCEQLDKTFVGGSLTALWSLTSRHASILSVCGMLVYNDVTSIEKLMDPEESFEDN